jgi:succinoglycan biosynthesis protein ExoA
MSEDGTRELLQQHVATHPEFRLIENPDKSVSAGLNRAVRAAHGEIIVRADVHTEYAPDYLRRCVAVLLETGADNVGGPARTKADSYLQEAICLGYQSPFSTGGAAFHDPNYEGYVDTVTYGCWRKSRLLELGLFDEDLVRNQDDELNLRIHRAGGKVYQSSTIKSWYRPRASLTALFRQYMQYGYWKVRVIQKHRMPASWRHLIPGAFVFGLILLTLVAPFWRVGLFAWLLWCGAYVCGNLVATLLTCARPGRLRFLPAMPAVFGAFHFGYGYGFLRGVVNFCLLRRRSPSAFTRLTRNVESAGEHLP